MITITLPDGSSRDYPDDATGLDIASSISEGLARNALAISVDGEPFDLNRSIGKDAQVRILTFDDPEGKEIFWHSSAHVLAQAVVELYPDALLTIGPAIDQGFYYDIDHAPFSEEDTARIDERMREIIKRNYETVRESVSKDKARTLFKNNPYKLELIDEYADEELTVYRQGDFVDLCRGPHIPRSGLIKAIAITKTSGAYWRADEHNKQLQRIYGISFPKKKQLDEYFDFQKAARERDHRKLGQELDLFSFSDLVGPGLPLFSPKGTIIRDELHRALLDYSKEFGMLPVTIPHIAKIDLYKLSGHAEKFEDELFRVVSHHGVEFVMKPVNCPHHTQIYASQPRSYRDLPLRYMESTMQYRDEKPGEIAGLSRVRAITCDDGHVFCRPDQIKDEARSIATIIRKFYSALGMYGSHWVSLSVRDPASPQSYIGDEDDWERAEAVLQELSDELGLGAKRMEGEAALYGPKLDFMFRDSLGRERQLSTIQLDFAMPKRFGLTYIDENNTERTPVMIHRAILGSYERFMAILIEHFAGKFPLWLAPEQIVLIPIADRHGEAARSIGATMKDAGLRVRVDDRSESVSYRVRDAQLKRVPYSIVIGDREANGEAITPRNRDNVVLDPIGQSVFIEQIARKIADRDIDLM
jgi:threonyl-tRNA synthetase